MKSTALQRVVSGGQTGADQAALDAALLLGFDVGGWVPKGRRNENGMIPSYYPNLRDADIEDPGRRTSLNVSDSDATVIFSHGDLSGGSQDTRDFAIKQKKPWKHVDLTAMSVAEAAIELKKWLSEEQPKIKILNVAGPRASEDPRIYTETRAVLEGVLTTLENRQTDIDLTVLSHLRESVLTQCGRWDQIRWGVPSWFTAVAALPIAFSEKLGRPSSLVSPQQVFAVLGAFGFLCCLLLGNLMLYDHKSIKAFNEKLSTYRLDSVLKSSLEIHRAFDFRFPRVFLTASFWFFLYTLLLTVLLLRNAFA